MVPPQRPSQPPRVDETLDPEAVFALGAMTQALAQALDCEGLEEAPLDAPPAPFVEAMGRFYEAYDRYLSARILRIPVRCSRGCAACCRDNPRGSTGVELLLLAQAAAALPDSEAVVEAARARSARYQERLGRLGSEDAAIAETKRLDAPCPLLGEGGACRIYDARPVACRMFFAITEPAWCAQGHPRHAEALNPHLSPPPLARALLLEISRRLGLDGLPRDLCGGLAEVSGRRQARAS